MKIPRLLMFAALVVLAVAVLAALFTAYQHPALVVDFANLVFCG